MTAVAVGRSLSLSLSLSHFALARMYMVGDNGALCAVRGRYASAIALCFIDVRQLRQWQ